MAHVAKIQALKKSTNQTKEHGSARRNYSSSKDPLRRTLISINPRIDKDMHGIELHLVPILSYHEGNDMASRLKQVAVKHIQIGSNIKKYEIDRFNNIDNQFSDSSGLTLRKLIWTLKKKTDKNFL